MNHEIFLLTRKRLLVVLQLLGYSCQKLSVTFSIFWREIKMKTYNFIILMSDCFAGVWR